MEANSVSTHVISRKMLPSSYASKKVASPRLLLASTYDLNCLGMGTYRY